MKQSLGGLLSLGVLLAAASSASCGGRTGLEVLTLNDGGRVAAGGAAHEGGTASSGGSTSLGGSVGSAGRVSAAGSPSAAGAASGGAGGCTWGFAPQVAYRVGSVPSDVASGDFDGDGFLDLATAAANDVRIFINRKDGSFARPIAYPGGEVPVSVSPGDLDGDGDLDLVAVTNVNGTSAVSVLFNQGNGAFRPPVTFPAGTTPDAVLIGDLNGDRSLDLAVNNSGTFSIFKNRGDGTFYPQDIYDLPGNAGLTLADFDGNGSLDIAATSFLNGTLGIILNKGSGTFNRPMFYPAGEGSGAMATADFDGDGATDLAIAHADLSLASEGNNTVAVLLNRTDGTFGARASYAVGNYAGSLRSGDFNADGSPDLVVVNEHDDTLSVLINQRDGTFRPQAVYATGRLPEMITIGDYNRDGWLDLAVNNWQDASIGVFLGQCR